ncbi:MAG: hypothetical protein ACTS73_09425 [Arsenophonus sp. NEOnobi-MAG3]
MNTEQCQEYIYLLIEHPSTHDKLGWYGDSCVIELRPCRSIYKLDTKNFRCFYYPVLLQRNKVFTLKERTASIVLLTVE